MKKIMAFLFQLAYVMRRYCGSGSGNDCDKTGGGNQATSGECCAIEWVYDGWTDNNIGQSDDSNLVDDIINLFG